MRLSCRTTVIVAALFACPAFAAPPREMPWDLKALSRVPKTFGADGFQADGLRAMLYEGEPQAGKPTRVFAWYGCPKVKPGQNQKVPAMVLVHGGGGTAFEKWVRTWVKAGYAAIAMDTCGGMPKRETRPGKPRGWMRHPHSGPSGWGDFDSIDKPHRDQWTYHAVSAVVLAHSLIRSFPEVDAARTGLTGISWGGYLTSITAGVDSRFQFAVPVYGCGFLGEDSAWLGQLEKLGPKRRAKWLKLWDPSRYLAHAKMPMLWATGTNDFAYPFTSLQKSYRLPSGARTLCIRVRMPHGHQWGPKEIYALADHVLKGAGALPKITAQGRDKRSVWATWQSPSPVVWVELNYTKDKGKWQKRHWQTMAGRLDTKANAKRVTAELPDGATTYYLNLTDRRGLLVSTEHEVVDASARWPMGPPPAASASAWPTYRADNARSGCTGQTLKAPLFPQWTHVPAHRPRPAWPEPGKEVHRMAFDYTYQLAAADGRVFYGSSADHQIHALDAGSGKELWSFFTEAPVRFAPCVSSGRVFAAGDDGRLYCLNAADGKLLWTFRGGPRDERFIGNGQMISRWPARSGVLVDGPTLYFTAGMWGPDGVYVYALRADDGSVIWKNDTANLRYMLLPHNNYEGITGVSPQGYLALGEGILLVPTGRAMPARFDAATGRLLPWKIAWGKHHRPGGAWTMAAKGLFFGARRRSTGLPEPSFGENSRLRPEGLMAWNLRTGRAELALDDVYRALVSGNTLYLTGGGYAKAQGHVMAIDLAKLPRKTHIPPPHTAGHDGAGAPIQRVTKLAEWQTATGRVHELIEAGDVLVAGAANTVTLLAADTGKVVWKTDVEGQARGLAVADGQLLVSTSTGRIYCFGGKKVAKPPVVAAGRDSKVQPKPAALARAKKIIGECGVRSGYCLVPGLDDPDLPLALIQQSDLHVIVLERDPDAAERMRRRYDRLGCYGARITVHRGDPKKLPYAPYFANLIVVGAASSCDPREAYRCLRPCGGVLAVLGEPDAARKFLAAAGAAQDTIVTAAGLVRTKRPALPGADSWSHPFANAGRTSASRDKLVRLPLKTLWFGGPGPARMVDRHKYPPIPVYANGRLFVPAQHQVIAVDAYNGREMWSRRLKDVGRFPGNDRGASVVADDRCVYVPHGLTCLQLDGETGKTLQTYRPPAKIKLSPAPAAPAATKGRKKKRGGRGRLLLNTPEWNYLAVTDRAVLGTVGRANVRKSLANWPLSTPRGEYLFALGKKDGKTLWTYKSQHGVAPKAIVADDKRVYILDQENRAGALGRAVVRAIDITTGAVVWTNPIEDRWELLLSENCLVAAGSGYSVYHADTGKLRWSHAVPLGLYDTYGAGIHHYRWSLHLRDFPVIPPIVVNGQIVAPPRAFDLKTGQEQRLACPLSGKPMLPYGVGNGGCGTYSASPALMFFRSGSLGMYDMATQTGMHWLGQVRPGCWINTLPAGGVVLMPEGASSCTCAYSFQTSIALVADTRHEEWGVYTCQPPTPGSRLKTVSLNFGAVGDKRDGSGGLWLGFPRPFSPQALRVPVTTCDAARYYRRNADETPIAGTDRPWLYSCGVEGLESAAVDLALTRPAVAPTAQKPPRIDGKLDDACWDGAEPIQLVDDSRRVDPDTRVWLRHDAENIYIGFRRKAPRKDGKPIPWTMNTKGEGAAAWQDDSLKVRFQSGSDTYAYLFLSASGARFTGQGGLGSTIRPARAGTVRWRSGVHVRPAVWSAEIAIATGKPRQGLKIFLEAFNRSGVGMERVFYKFRSWRRWFVTGGEASVVFDRPKAMPPRSYTLRLHFAELENVKPGQRVFDVKVQDKLAIKALDVVAAAGGRRRALTRTIRGVRASETISIGLVRSPDSKHPAILSAVEIFEEK